MFNTKCKQLSHNWNIFSFTFETRSTQVPQKLLTSRSLCASLSESMVSMTEVWKPFSWVMSQTLRLTISLETGCHISEHNRPAWPRGRESKHKAVMTGVQPLVTSVTSVQRGLWGELYHSDPPNNTATTPVWHLPGPVRLNLSWIPHLLTNETFITVKAKMHIQLKKCLHSSYVSLKNQQQPRWASGLSHRSLHTSSRKSLNSTNRLFWVEIGNGWLILF